MKTQADPLHPIIERPWEYEIVSLGFHQGESEPFIDLALRKERDVRHLRFLGARELEIERGFPTWTSGLIIFDVSARGMEGLGVRVDDFEADGAVRFWAREVLELRQFTES